MQQNPWDIETVNWKAVVAEEKAAWRSYMWFQLAERAWRKAGHG